ncbi:MFS transporter [Paenibacillus sp. GCM10027626]|uniref:MFS transporter n=1 Tax=Paenibacillus sp. GCM10027626 TaxID=3273411 RepID=UPI0036D27F46
MKNNNKLLAVLIFALIFSVMNGTMFNVALPVIGAEFQLTPSELSWIMTGYMMLYAVGSVVFGKLADRYRLKDLLTIGLLLFAVGSIVGATAGEYWVVIAGRLLQAAGASVLPATAMIIPIRYFPQESRGKALGTSAIGLAIGGAIGPIVAGLVVGIGSWRLLFVLSLLSLLTLPFFRKYLDNARGSKGSMDYLGGALLAATITLLLLAITQRNLWLLLVFAVLLILFIVRIRNAADPFIQPAIFRNRSFSVALLLSFLTTAMSFSLTFMTPQFLASLNGLLPGSIGLVLFPAAAASALLGRKGGKLADEKGNLFLVTIGSGLLFLCFALLSSLVGMSPYVIAIIVILGNVGQTFMQVSMSNTISRTLTREQTGVGMGLFSMLNFIAGAIAMSIIGTMLDQPSTTLQLNPLVSSTSAYMYSNILTVISISVMFVYIVYRYQFGGAKQSSKATI